MAIRLRYLAHDLEVPVGQFLIGRTPDCQLSLDDALVSRRHALLTVQGDGVFVEDLGSRNGVFLNNAKVLKRTRVMDGDVVRVGGQELILFGIGDAPIPSSRPQNPMTATMQDLRVIDPRELAPDEDVPTSVNSPVEPSSSPDRRVNSLSLIGGVADKALALGRADEAERILQRSLNETLIQAGGGKVRMEFAEKAAFYALRLATGTGRASWVDYVFELYTVLRAPLPARLVDELYAVVRKVKPIDRAVMKAYMACLREISHGFGPAERFVQQRIEGLERWVQ
jgi:FHA domain